MTYRTPSTVNIGCGAPSVTLIFLVFLLLKVFGVVDWSWWIVTIPLWGPIAFVLLLLLVASVVLGITFLVAYVIDKVASYRRRRKHKKLLERRGRVQNG